MDIPREDLVDMYETMVKIRRFEERIREIYFADKLPAFDIAAGLVPGEMHLAAGQEPVAWWGEDYRVPGDRRYQFDVTSLYVTRSRTAPRLSVQSFARIENVPPDWTR